MTPLLLGVAGVILVFGIGIADVGILLAARLQAATAADAAALAAAPVTFRPFGATAGPVEEARRLAEANGARISHCVCVVDSSWDARSVEVVVERVARLVGFGTLTVRASSRAEFDPSKLLGPEATPPTAR